MMTSLLFFLAAAIVNDDQSFTVNGPGLTSHGHLNRESYHMMKHRLGDNMVWHPVEAGLIYKKQNIQLGADFLKDCFGHKAGSIFAGPKVDFWRYFSVGGMFGAYVRETMKGGAVPMVKTVKGVDIMPMAGGTFSVSIPIVKHVAIEMNGLVNFYDNHATVGLKIWN